MCTIRVKYDCDRETDIAEREGVREKGRPGRRAGARGRGNEANHFRFAIIHAERASTTTTTATRPQKGCERVILYAFFFTFFFIFIPPAARAPRRRYRLLSCDCIARANRLRIRPRPVVTRVFLSLSSAYRSDLWRRGEDGERKQNKKTSRRAHTTAERARRLTYIPRNANRGSRRRRRRRRWCTYRDECDIIRPLRSELVIVGLVGVYNNAITFIIPVSG